jgi:hypothetical protein
MAAISQIAHAGDSLSHFNRPCRRC